MLCLLISSLLFSHLVSSSHISSADLSFCQLVSPHLSFSQCTLKPLQLFSSPKPAPKTDLGAKASDPYAVHREDLSQRSFCTQQAFAQRSLYTTEAFAQRQGSFYSQKTFDAEQAFTHSKRLHRNLYTEAFSRSKLYIQQTFTHRSFYTEKHLHSKASTHKSFYTEKPLHREACTHSKLSHKEAPTEKFVHREAFTHSFYRGKPVHSFHAQQASTQRSPYTEKLLHTEAFTHREPLHTASPYTERVLHTASFYTQNRASGWCRRSAASRLSPGRIAGAMSGGSGTPGALANSGVDFVPVWP